MIIEGTALENGSSPELARQTMLYDRSRSYDWNYEHAPKPAAIGDVSEPTFAHRFLGMPCDSPLGIAAGPLLNSDWILYYARLGYDILTYKTVRSRTRECYAMPNLLPVECESHLSPATLHASETMRGSWAISFGMPSKAPGVWMPDVQRAREKLPAGKLLTVSVVATPQPHWTLDQIADDYADVARRAVESGADSIEANFSCPNVSSADGQLHQDASSARVVAARIRQAIGDKPLALKMGAINDAEAAKRLLDATAGSINGLSMINCIPANVNFAEGQPAFGGESRGIGGTAIREAVLRQVKLFQPLADEFQIEIIGVGGVSTRDDYRALLDAGVSSVQVATAAMLDPDLPSKLR